MSDSVLLRIVPERNAWRVTVMTLDHHGIATTIENTPFEAAVIGVGLWRRWQAAQ